MIGWVISAIIGIAALVVLARLTAWAEKYGEEIWMVLIMLAAIGAVLTVVALFTLGAHELLFE